MALEGVDCRVWAFLTAASIPSASSVAFFRVNFDSASSRLCICVSAMPQTNLSRSISSRLSPKLQNFANECNSAVKVAIDSLGCLTRVLNLYRCTISDGVGLWCLLIAATNSSYVNSAGFFGVIRLHNNLYAAGPIMVKKTERFLFLSSMPFAAKKCVRLLHPFFLLFEEFSHVTEKRCCHPQSLYLVAKM